MAGNLAKLLDVCLTRIARGEEVEQCLADYPQLRERLEPLLKTALAISSAPQITAPEQFRRQSRERLVSRLRAESAPELKVQRGATLPHWSSRLVTRSLIPAALAVLLAVTVWRLLPASNPPYSPVPGATTEFTLNILSGNAEVLTSDSSGWQTGTDGLKLAAGSRVRTTLASHAVLTFPDGITTKLEPGTDIAVLQSEHDTKQYSLNVMIDQKLGKTWNHIPGEQADGISFRIETPSATITAHGTSFSAEVDTGGATSVMAVEGKVQVVAQDREVQLVMNQSTLVNPGQAPASPEVANSAMNELVVSTGSTAITSVHDPSGSTTGYLPDGTAVNYITGSKSSLSREGQRTEIGELMSGEYTITVRSLSAEAAPVSIQTISSGEVTSAHTEILPGNTAGGWVIRVRVGIENGTTVKSEVIAIEPLGKESTSESTGPVRTEEKPAPGGPDSVPPPSLPAETTSPVKDTSNNSGTDNVSPTPVTKDVNVGETQPAPAPEPTLDATPVASPVPSVDTSPSDSILPPDKNTGGVKSPSGTVNPSTPTTSLSPTNTSK